MRSSCRLAAAAAALAVLGACGGESPTAGDQPPASVILAELPDTLGVGDTLRARATVRSASGTLLAGVAVRWTSSDPTVAVVDSLTGLVHALAPGDVSLEAQSGDVVGGVTVRVERLPRWIGLSDVRTTMTFGDSAKPLVAVFDGRDQQLSGTAVSWSSSDTNVVRITPDGYLKGVGDGISHVVARSGTASISREIDVSFVRVPSPAPLAAIGVAWTHQCAVDASGGTYCVGDNSRGQLGTGEPTSAASAFIPSAGGLTFAQIDAGFENSCGVTAGGVLYCWGGNGYLQVRPTAADSRGVSTPTVQRPGTTFRKVSVGPYGTICALGTDDAIYCWGTNYYYEVGREPPSRVDSARAPVSGSLRFLDVAVGGFGGCGVALDGDAYCWATYGASGRSQSEPRRILGGRKFVSIAASPRVYCALESGGAVSCWGTHVASLVPGAAAPFDEPKPVPGDIHFASLSVGSTRACGLTAAGALYCWSTKEPLPRRLSTRRTFRSLDMESDRVCAISAEREAFCF